MGEGEKGSVRNASISMYRERAGANEKEGGGRGGRGCVGGYACMYACMYPSYYTYMYLCIICTYYQYIHVLII